MWRGCLLFCLASFHLSAQEPPGLLDAARGNGADFTKSLPDYICTETIHRFQAHAGSNSWRSTDALVIQVTYSRGKEVYQLESINGQPTDKAYDDVGGAFSTGEFGSWLDSIFKPSASAGFDWQGRNMVRNRAVGVYGFRVARPNSSYELSDIEGVQRQLTVAGYHGKLAIDLATKRVVQISLEADDIPRNFPLRSSSILLQYDFAEIGGRNYLLPRYADVHTSTAKLQFRNEVTFSVFRKFEASSSVHFGDSGDTDLSAPVSKSSAVASGPASPAAISPELSRFHDESGIFPPPLAPSGEEQHGSIDEARRAAASYLPEFACTGRFGIYVTPAGHESWKLRSAAAFDLSHSKYGGESYQWISVEKSPIDDDANPTVAARQQAAVAARQQVELSQALNASTWNVMFNRLEEEVLDPTSSAQFHWDRLVALRGRPTLVYSFSVDSTGERYILRAKAGRSWIPLPVPVGQHGSVYVDRDARLVTRIFAESGPIPAGLPLVHASVLVDFAFDDVAGTRVLLPVRSVRRVDTETLSTRYVSEFSPEKKQNGHP